MSYIVVSEIEHVAYVKMHRPDTRNAFNPEMIQEITEVFLKLAPRKDLRAIALLGEGKVFCAGADLAWMKSMVNFSIEENRADAKKLFNMFEAIASCPQPTIALVQGAAFGGALGLVAAVDYVIAEEGTQFCFSEVKLGIAPAVISAFVMKKANPGLVRPLMLTGKVFDPASAQTCGLVHEIVGAGDGHHALAKMIHVMKEAGPHAVRETKKLIDSLCDLSWAEQKEKTSSVIAELRVGTEGQEGLKSFLEKRQPSWRHQ